MEEPVIVLSSGENGDDDHDNEVQVVEVKGGGSVVEVIDLTCSPYDDEYAVLSDMRGFENLAAMLEAEKFRRKKKRKRKKRRKWHECIAPQPAGNFENVEEQMNRKAVETNKVWETEINPISVKAMPQNLGGNVEYKEEQVNLKAVETNKVWETETNPISVKDMRQNLGVSCLSL